MPKSLIFKTLPSPTRQFLAARSLRDRQINVFTVCLQVVVCLMSAGHCSAHLWIQFLLSRYAMPAAASTEKRMSCFVFNSSFFFLRKDRKSPPDRHSTGSHRHNRQKQLTLCQQ